MIGKYIALEFIRQAFGGSRSTSPPAKSAIPGELYGSGMGRIPTGPVRGSIGIVRSLPKAPFVPSRTFTPDTKVGTRPIIAPLKRI